MIRDWFNQLLQRLQGYSPGEVALELVLIWITVYVMVRFLRGTRGARVMQGMALILLLATPLIHLLSSDGRFERINFLYGQFVAFAALALVIVFQPELRRGLVRLGEARLLRGLGPRRGQLIDELVSSAAFLSQHKIGALIAIERHVGLEGVVEAGTRLDALVSRELLNTIFWDGSALHDMAVLIRDERILAAGVQLPLAEGEHFSSELGSRHRAAIGLTQESDAMVVVVSEESGTISLAQRGRLDRNLSAEELRALLVHGLGNKSESSAPKLGA